MGGTGGGGGARSYKEPMKDQRVPVGQDVGLLLALTSSALLEMCEFKEKRITRTIVMNADKAVSAMLGNG